MQGLAESLTYGCDKDVCPFTVTLFVLSLVGKDEDIRSGLDSEVDVLVLSCSKFK